ncbi:MAG TPA: hypothetical protein VGM98_19055 [Schlesneria sp.]
MNDSSGITPPHEQFGYTVVERALSGEGLRPWENDYARLFWQSLEVHNGGFAQWIGNTGVEGALETLEILDRRGFFESHRVTKLAFELVKLDSYNGKLSFYEYLGANVGDWFERLRGLDEAYWNDADVFDKKLNELFRVNTEQADDVK